VIAAVALLAATIAGDAGGADAGARGDGGDVREASPARPDAAATDGGVPDAAPAEVRPAPPVGRLAGRVLAQGTRKPVAGASLIADVSEVGASDERGDFAVDVPCGQRRLSIQAPGFERLTAIVDACAGPAAPLTLRLMPAESGRSFETVVRSKPAQPEVRLEAEELTQTPGTLGDPFRAIESLPGVATIAWPAPVYAVRGSNPGNTGFFLDGIRVPALFHFALGPSVIHPYFFESLEFFPGGYPARYGRYAAGIVSADTRAAAEDRIHSSVDIRLFDAGAMVSAPFPGNGAVAVAGRYSYTAGLVSLLNQDIRLEYWDYQLRADRRFGPFQLGLLAFGSGDLLAPRRDETLREIDLGFHRVSLRAAAPLGGGRVQASLAVGSDHSKAPIADVYPITVNAISAAPRLAYLLSFAPIDVALGFDGEITRYDPVTTIVRPTGDWDLARKRVAVLLAGYASATVRAGSRLIVTPELRYDSYDVGDAHASDLAPRLTARLKLRDDTAIKAGGGHFTQLPSLPLQIPGVEAFGLRLFGLQSSWQASLGLETSRLPGLDVTVTGYVQRYVLTDLRDPTPNSPDPLADDFLVRRDALSYGLEVLARRPLSQRLHGWLAYTLSNNLRSLGGGAVGPSDWDQRHILNLVVGYRRGPYTVGGRGHLNTGRPFIASMSTGEGFQRLPTFYQVDLRFDRRIIYARFILNVYLELVNATLSRQVYSVTETSPGQFKENSFSIVLPSIGVRGEF
jgi:TonB-dependent receptor-like protein